MENWAKSGVITYFFSALTLFLAISQVSTTITTSINKNARDIMAITIPVLRPPFIMSDGACSGVDDGDIIIVEGLA